MTTISLGLGARLGDLVALGLILGRKAEYRPCWGYGAAPYGAVSSRAHPYLQKEIPPRPPRFNRSAGAAPLKAELYLAIVAQALARGTSG